MGLAISHLRDNTSKIITRNRSRGDYSITANIRAKTITKDKANKLQDKIGIAIRELGLVGVVSMKCIIRSR